MPTPVEPRPRPPPRPAQISIQGRPGRVGKTPRGASLWANLVGLVAGLGKRPRVALPQFSAPLAGGEGSQLELQAFSDAESGESALDGVQLSSDGALGSSDLGLEQGFAFDPDIDVIGDELVHRSPGVGVPEGLEPVSHFQAEPVRVWRTKSLDELQNRWLPVLDARLGGVQSPFSSMAARQFAETAAVYAPAPGYEAVSWDRLEPMGLGS